MQTDPGLVDVGTRLYNIFNTGDVAVAEALVSAEKGILGIGTDPREWWVDDAMIGAFHAQVPEMHGAGLRFEPGAIQGYSEGSVGWIADQPTLRMPDGTGLPMRLTAVCRREAGAWKMVQFHLSVGVANEEALGEELSI